MITKIREQLEQIEDSLQKYSVEQRYVAAQISRLTEQKVNLQNELISGLERRKKGELL